MNYITSVQKHTDTSLFMIDYLLTFYANFISTYLFVIKSFKDDL